MRDVTVLQRYTDKPAEKCLQACAWNPYDFNTFLMKRQKKIKQDAQFLISSLRNYQIYILNLAKSKKVIDGDDLETKSMTFKAKEFQCLIFTAEHIISLYRHLQFNIEISPCIMCVQYRGGAQYRGGYLEYRGGVQYRGGYHDKCGGYLEYRGGVQYRGGYHVAGGDIMSTVEGVQYLGGKNLLLFEYPTVLNTPHGTHDIPHMYHDIPLRYSNFKGWYPPTVLNTLHGTHDIPHVHHDIPPRYSWFPYGTQDIPKFIPIFPHGTEHPHGTHDIPPRYSWYPPRYWAPPTVLSTPHGTAHTLYRVNI